jgi:hypothetical protein
MKFALPGILLMACLSSCDVYAQDQQETSQPSTSAEVKSATDKIANFPNKLFGKVNKKIANLESKLDKQTDKYLKKLARQESTLKKELQKTDSANSAYLFFNDPGHQYQNLALKLKSDSARLIDHTRSEYLPYADSLQGSLSFLSKNPQFLSTAGNIMPATVQNSLTNVTELQAKMQDAELAQQYIIERKEQIKQYILMHSNLPASITGIFNDYNKELYYYQSQLNEYKQILNDPDKMLKAALVLLDKIPAFSQFMQKNSFLSGIAGAPDDYNMQGMIPGMQTRDMINQMIQGQVSAGGPGASAAFSQNLESAQGQLEGLKDKLSSLGSSGTNTDLPPNFKPNTQKSKSLWKRLEFGTNIQSVQANYYFPTTTDFALTIGYKINDKSVIGVGGSYKIGWGKDINHISTSSQGAGLRSYLDFRVKGGLYATGGYEYNFQPVAGVDIKNINSWQKSGLIGISKVVPLHTKPFKETKLQLLWDFLSYQQIPKTQPIKFRIGYNF